MHVRSIAYIIHIHSTIHNNAHMVRLIKKLTLRTVLLSVVWSGTKRTVVLSIYVHTGCTYVPYLNMHVLFTYVHIITLEILLTYVHSISGTTYACTS